MHVLVFDSGVGGLSILEELQQLNPELQYSYLFDNLYFPYGELADNQLVERVLSLLKLAVHQLKPDIIVVACNSASTLSLPYLRETLTIPVVGVVPAIKSAAKLSQTKHFGLLATPGTVERSYTAQLINDFAADCQVELVGSTSLVQLAEQKLAGEQITLEAIKAVVEPWLSIKTLDCVVLGCTHFPLLKEELQQVLGEKVKLVDSGPAIAKRVQSLLIDASKPNLMQKKAETHAYCTEHSANSDLLKQLQHYGLHSLQLLT
ncbi:glutamate racemase [Agarivorans sp. 1_MG-2023]|uniref:glutamate racemase n=1 Tax=Agarivorans sp. 1_MG-2023 TaxID=3062634 RepID=UPI0026E2A339|nr:glutamate racemase [Agarivorans sp. 1_MG-2023]MDO6765668.1 glutamate racemase [Agarivorans sp. 1_MG-2023]